MVYWLFPCNSGWILSRMVINRFTELYVNELSTNDDLRKLILSYISNAQLSEDVIQGIIK